MTDLASIANEVEGSIVGEARKAGAPLSGYFCSQYGPNFMKHSQLEEAVVGMFGNHQAAYSYILLPSVTMLETVRMGYVIKRSSGASIVLLKLMVFREVVSTHNCS